MLSDEIIQATRKTGHRVHRFQLPDILETLGRESARQYVTRVVRGMVEQGDLLREGGGRYTYYALPEYAHALQNRIHRHFTNQDLQEHLILAALEREAPFLRALSDNVQSIFAYAFSEMLNNAIDHSESPDIDVTATAADGDLVFEIEDKGVGVFRNVEKKHHLASALEAAQELLKGKTTTAPQAHSGEGIFFTSKIADTFALDSYGQRLLVDNKQPDVFIEQSRLMRGTKVTFQVSLDSTKHLSDIFRHFQTDSESLAFDKTEIQVKLYVLGTVHVSRSQARRVMAGLPEKFAQVILDFDRVPTVGQAFADEIFRVYRNKYPTLTITPVNMNETVRFMIERVGKN